MPATASLTKLPAGHPKKYRVTVVTHDGKKRKKRTVNFGQQGASDYTRHKDVTRKKRYLTRHGGGRENWTASGIFTAGFWSRWLLWSKPSLAAAKSEISRRFAVKFVR